jgi:hypothetical protein
MSTVLVQLSVQQQLGFLLYKLDVLMPFSVQGMPVYSDNNKES